MLATPTETSKLEIQKKNCQEDKCLHYYTTAQLRGWRGTDSRVKEREENSGPRTGTIEIAKGNRTLYPEYTHVQSKPVKL